MDPREFVPKPAQGEDHRSQDGRGEKPAGRSEKSDDPASRYAMYGSPAMWRSPRAALWLSARSSTKWPAITSSMPWR